MTNNAIYFKVNKKKKKYKQVFLLNYFKTVFVLKRVKNKDH